MGEPADGVTQRQIGDFGVAFGEKSLVVRVSSAGVRVEHCVQLGNEVHRAVSQPLGHAGVRHAEMLEVNFKRLQVEVAHLCESVVINEPAFAHEVGEEFDEVVADVSADCL